MMFALKKKGKMQFFCMAKSKVELNEKIASYYLSWRIMQSKGNDVSKQAFMAGMRCVKVTIEPI